MGGVGQSGEGERQKNQREENWIDRESKEEELKCFGPNVPLLWRGGQ